MTYRAHCGQSNCAGLLILVHVSGSGIWRYRCQECGHETEPRPTPAEADDDVVWVPVKAQRQVKEPPP